MALADAWASWLESIVDFFSFGTIQLQPLYRTIFFLKKEKRHLLAKRLISCVCGAFAMAQTADAPVAAALEIKLDVSFGSALRQLNIH